MVKTSIGCFETEADAILAFEEKLKPKEQPKSQLLFLLTMPSAGSWNGKWTGEGAVYARVFHYEKLYGTSKKAKEKLADILKNPNYYYNFGDGWGANVEVRQVTVKEANRYLKKSKGFYGYDWMIDSILRYGEILNSKQRKEC